MIHLKGKEFELLTSCIFLIIAFLPDHFFRITIELYMQGVVFLERADLPGFKGIMELADTKVFYGMGFESFRNIFYVFSFMVFSGFSIQIFQRKFGITYKEAIAVSIFGFFSFIAWALIALASLKYLDGGVLVTKFYFLVIVGPILEELFFRGFMYRFLQDLKVNIVPATVIISTLFVLSHSYMDGFFMHLNFFIVSSVLVYFKWKYKSIFIPIAAHIALNFIGYLKLISS